MHPHIHPQDKVNRPEHDHNYTLTSQVHNHRTRYSAQNHHFIPHAKHYSKSKQPAITAAHYTAQYTRVWNSIPAALKADPSRLSLKHRLKSYLLDRQNTN